MAVRYNPFTKLKLHGGSYIAPAGAEQFYKGQELAQATEREDFVELEKHVVYEEEGLTPLAVHRAAAGKPVADVEAGTEAKPYGSAVHHHPMMTMAGDDDLTTKLLPIESQSLDKTKVDAKQLLRLPRAQRCAVIQRLLEDKPIDSVAFLDKIHEHMVTYVVDREGCSDWGMLKRGV